MFCVDLGESFQTHIFLQKFVSIQPRTDRLKFADHDGARSNDDLHKDRHDRGAADAPAPGAGAGEAADKTAPVAGAEKTDASGPPAPDVRKLRAREKSSFS